MRQWGIDPRMLCQKHLLGEHVEHHMFVGSIHKGISLHGYTSTGLVHVPSIVSRHEELVAEMDRRGMNHKSPLDTFEYEGDDGYVDITENIRELIRRCPDCALRIAHYASPTT